ncbi:Sirohydrochlorin cobaltochelatase CbiX(long) [hydrothermal vent metagenome]|uniref:Sirohydrochlorin cobaltochelatase CbiX(Long) n=1 Tax=hydrothermal vent metagenome TaxID=652676 RepID=A0A3B0Y611_9ZZZZ
MNTTILLVGHGSRYLPGNAEIKQFSTQWQAMNPQWRIETCFIEFADVLLDAGLDTAAKGAERVIVVPLILNAAGHVKMEIPQHISAARQRHAKVQFIYAAHLGANDAILTILKRNLRKVLAQIDMPDPKTTGVILLGRGASDRIANGEVAKMARWLFDESDHEHIDIAFTGITYPRLEAVVKQQVALGMTQIAILPYYLFTGTLTQRIKRQLQRLQQQYPSIVIAQADYFGFETEIFTLLNQRVNTASGSAAETRIMECDGCKYRQLAEDHGHGHHHAHPEGNAGVAA